MTLSLALTSVHPVPALGLEARRYDHPCGLVHWHLACADEHRAFAIAFRTPPYDDTGLPHILEHTTLCGSRRYPVRDPFFQMLRRSLQTFMNAMTYPDLTAYPFATQVSKDYANLLGVYLDAVFAPRLRELDFAQEGHRLAPGPARQGVVFNEMKGAMDSTHAQVEQACARLLLPGTCYAWNSGGEPNDIPRLSHADLVAFHRRCYCPANAVITTYGNLDPQQIHTALAPYLETPGQTLPPPVAARAQSARDADVPVPWAEGQDATDVAATSLTWAWGDSADLDTVLDGELIDRLLLDHAGSPLRQALEGCGFARSAGHSGFGAHYRTGEFTAALEGCLPADHHRLPPLVTACLEEVARAGLPAADLAAALHQVELSRREIQGDHFPYGLELCLRLVGPWNLGADPLPFLDQAAALARLRSRAMTPGWLSGQLRARLLDNPHRVWLRAIPDREFHARAAADEAARNVADVAALGPTAEARLAADAAALAAHQATHDDPTVLPDLDLADVPRARRWAEGRVDGTLTIFTPGTNGLLHHVVALPVPALDDGDLDLLPLATALVGQLGSAGRTYAEQAARQNACCGALSAWLDLGSDPADPGILRPWWLAEVKGLGTKSDEFLPLLAEAVQQLRLDEHERLRELVDQAVQRLRDRLAGSGSQHAARAAQRGRPGAAGLGHRLHGIGRLRWLEATAEAIEDDAACGALLARCGAVLTTVLSGAAQHALIGDSAETPALLAAVRARWPVGVSGSVLNVLASTPPAPTGFAIATGVNYVALSFAAPGLSHGDAPALAVAARLLTNGWLHPRLREQGGAYGGGASYQGGTGSVTLSSFRDPRLDGTVADMRGGLTWLRDSAVEPRLLKEAVLGVIAGMDAPGSPAGEARGRFTADLKGQGPAVIDRFRAGVLAVTPDQVTRVAGHWLDPELGRLAVVSSASALAASSLGLTVETV